MDVLKSLRPESHSKETSSVSSASTPKSPYQLTQEQIADVYFPGAGTNPRKSDMPMVIRVVEPRPASYQLPWLITTIALFFCAFALFSTKKVMIDVKIIDEATLQSHPEALSQTEGSRITPNASEIIPLSPKTSLTESKTFKTSPLKILPSQAVFTGSGAVESHAEGDVITLVNSDSHSFAQCAFELDRPIDLSTTKLVFMIKGKRGGENLELVLRDTRNISSLMIGSIKPLSQPLGTDWQKVEMTFNNLEQTSFDLRHVAYFRFEFGSKRAGNRVGDTLFIKDLQFLPA